MLDDRGHSKLFSNVWESLSFVSLTAATNEDKNCFVTRVEFQQCSMKRAKCGDVKPFLLPSQRVWIYTSTPKNTQQVRRSISLSHNAQNREVKRETVWKHPPEAAVLSGGRKSSRIGPKTSLPRACETMFYCYVQWTNKTFVVHLIFGASNEANEHAFSGPWTSVEAGSFDLADTWCAVLPLPSECAKDCE